LISLKSRPSAPPRYSSAHAARNGTSYPVGLAPFAGWIAAVSLILFSLFGIGKVVLGETAAGLGLLALAAVCFAGVMRNLRS